MADRAQREKEEQEKFAKARDKAKRDEMTGWIERTFADPEFRAFDGPQKIRIMEQADPEFAEIPSVADKARIVQSYMYQVPKGQPSTGSSWRDFAEGFTASALQPVYYGGDILRRGVQKAFPKAGEKLEQMGVPKRAVEMMGLEGRPLEDPGIQALITPPSSVAGKAGAIAEPIAEVMLAPELRARQVPKLLKSGAPLMRGGKAVMRETVPSFAARSATEGIKMGVQSELHGDKPVPGAIIGASMPTVGFLVRSIASPAMSASARWLYNRALRPTTKITKGETAEVVPELLTRRFWAGTFPRFRVKVEDNVATSGKEVEQAENAARARLAQTHTTTGYYNVPPRPRARPRGQTINVPPAGGAGTAGGTSPGAARAGGPAMAGAGRPAIPGITPEPLVRTGVEEVLGPEEAAGARRFQDASERVRNFFRRASARQGTPPPGAPGAGAGAGGAAAAGGRAGYRVHTTMPGVLDVKPVFDKLIGELNQTHVGGVFPTPQAEKLYNQLADQAYRLAQAAQPGWSPHGIYGWYMSLDDAIKFRRILDRPLGQAGVFYNDPAWASLFHVQELTANSLRGVIKDNVPELVQPYANFHLWKTTNHILEQTERRKIGQFGFLHFMATTGTGVQALYTGDVTQFLRDVVLANAAASFAESIPAQTGGGVFLQRVADSLDNRNLDMFLEAAGTIMRPGKDRGDEDLNIPPPLPGRAAAASIPPAAAQGPTPPDAQYQESAPPRGAMSSVVRSQIVDTGRQLGGDQMPELPRIMQLVATQESGGRQTGPGGGTLTSPKGAMGIMQLTQETADTYQVDPHNPADNIRGGGMYLRDLISEFGSDTAGLPKVFAAYYGGPKQVRQYGDVPPQAQYPLTYQYVVEMMGRMGYRWPPSVGR